MDGIRRVPLDVDIPELESRLVLCYTGEPRNSGTNNWEITKKHIDGDRHVFDCFERIRDAAGAMRDAIARKDWDGVGAAIARRVGDPQTAGARRVDARDRRPDRARTTRGCDGRKGLRRRRRRMPVLLRSAGSPRRHPRRAGRRRRPPARLPHRTPRARAWITGRSRRSSPRLPTCSKSREKTPSRFARTGPAPTRSRHGRTRWRGWTRRSCARCPASARISPPRFVNSRRPAPACITRSCCRNFRRPSSTCCACRASGRRPSPCSTRR